MTQISNNYGLVLLESAILANEIEDTKKIIFDQPMLLEALKSPIVSLAEKEKIIDAVFPEGIRKFLKVVAVHHDFNKIQDIFAAYDKHRRKKEQEILATIYYVQKPDTREIEQIQETLAKRFHAQKVTIEWIEKKKLIDGFIIQVGDIEMDWSMEGRLRQLENKLTRR